VPSLLWILAGTAGLWLLSRTERGQVVAADVVGAVKNALTPRGIRNNNPGNIEWIEAPANRWRGMIRADGRYGVFDTAANGVRAIGGELRASIRKGQTLAQAIAEWAPPTENNTAAYQRAVASETGILLDTKLAAHHVPAVATAIIQHENGMQPYAWDDVVAWVNS